MSVNRNQMLYDLGELLVEKKLVEQNPGNNSGAKFSCDLFTFNAYCWCEGENPEHEDGCDDGFSFSHPDLGSYWAGWYKHIFRGFFEDDSRSDDDFFRIISLCRDEINQAGVEK